MPVRSRTIPRAAAPIRARVECAALALHTRHGARLFDREHRDRRLLQRAGHDGVDVSLLREFRARHELWHRLGVVRAVDAYRWDPQASCACALCESRFAWSHRRETFLSRSFAT